jgi:hypothetical protein
MSPEQARGDRVDTRTDVYSLGITVYEMLAGRVPFEADSTLSVLHKQIYDPPPPIEGLSKKLQEVIGRALAKDPDQRFQTPLELAEAFEAAITGTAEAETALFPSALAKSITTTRQNFETAISKDRKNLFIPVVIGVITVVVVFGALMLGRTDNQSVPTPSLPAPTEEPVLVVAPTVQASTPTADSHSAEGHGDDYASMPTAPANATVDPAASNAEAIGLLRFQDGSAQADKVTFSSGKLPPPPDGKQYEAWLLDNDGESLFSIGIIQFDAENRASLTFVDDAGRNLITFYHGLQITVEPVGDNNPNPSNEIAFSASLPAGGFSHVRHLLSSFGSTPDQVGFIRGLVTDTDLLTKLSEDLLESLEAGDETNARLQAEQMLNLIVGNQSDQHKDWNGNGAVDDISDGYGLLLNGTNNGYIQGTISHANLALTSPDATENMLTHGDHVKIAAENVSGWTPQLRDQLIAVIEAPSLAEAEGVIRQAVNLVNQIRNGVDTNGNENIEAIPGEGGVMTAYDHSYYMADILLKP